MLFRSKKTILVWLNGQQENFILCHRSCLNRNSTHSIFGINTTGLFYALLVTAVIAIVLKVGTKKDFLNTTYSKYINYEL
jgi:hypothetical protein